MSLPTCAPGRCDLVGRATKFPWGPIAYVFGCRRCHYTTATVSHA